MCEEERESQDGVPLLLNRVWTIIRNTNNALAERRDEIENRLCSVDCRALQHMTGKLVLVLFCLEGKVQGTR